MTWEMLEPVEPAGVAIRPPPTLGRRGIDRDVFASIMGTFAAGVAIVTTRDAQGNPMGLTSTAVASISAEPPLLVVSIDLRSRTLPVIRHVRRFVVNFVRAGRREIGSLFASKEDEKFAKVVWSKTGAGLPYLPEDVLAWAECTTVQEIEAGDHMVLLGRVDEGEVMLPEETPLVYYRRQWGIWSPEPHAHTEPPERDPRQAT